MKRIKKELNPSFLPSIHPASFTARIDAQPTVEYDRPQGVLHHIVLSLFSSSSSSSSYLFIFYYISHLQLYELYSRVKKKKTVDGFQRYYTTQWHLSFFFFFFSFFLCLFNAALFSSSFALLLLFSCNNNNNNNKMWNRVLL